MASPLSKPGAPGTAKVTYNGYRFPGNTETTGFQGRAIWDAAGRTIVYWLYSITLKFQLSNWDEPGSPSDDNADEIRSQLTEPAGVLEYSDTGFGAFDVNTKGRYDVVWGPKPQMIQFRHSGADRTIEVVWKVDVAIPECANAKTSGQIMECCYRWSVAIDASGYSTRRLTGFLRIPQTRNSPADKTLSDNADKYRDQIAPPPLPGFRRIPGEFNLDESKCRLDFSVTDEEMPPNIPPPGVVHCSAEHSVESTGQGFAKWGGMLSASYELAKGLSRADAWGMFMDLWAIRHNAAKNSKVATVILPIKITAREPEIYGRNSASFTLHYMYTCTIKVLLERPKDAATWFEQGIAQANAKQKKLGFITGSGMFTGTGGNWDKWSDSMVGNGVWRIRGVAGLAFANKNDAIIDLCDTSKPKQVVDANAPVVKAVNFDRVPLKEPIDPKNSWLAYDVKVVANVNDETVELKLLPDENVEPKQNPGDLSSSDSYRTPYVAKQVHSIIQKRANPTIYVWLTGRAMRACYDINPPQLKAIGDVEAVQCNDSTCYFRQAVVANYGVPIIAAKWKQKYLLGGVPQAGFDPPKNFIMAPDEISPGVYKGVKDTRDTTLGTAKGGGSTGGADAGAGKAPPEAGPGPGEEKDVGVGAEPGDPAAGNWGNKSIGQWQANRPDQGANFRFRGGEAGTPKPGPGP